MPLLRLDGRALVLLAGCAIASACAPLPPPVFEPPAATAADGGPPPARPEAAAGPRVSGRLLTADGSPLIAGTIVLRPLDGASPPAAAPDDAQLTPVGEFEFRNVRPGRYQIRARGQTQKTGPSLHATFGITVTDRDLANIKMILAPGSRVMGQLVVNAIRSPKPLSLDGISVRALSAGSSLGDAINGHAGPDGAFVIHGLMSGPHFITLEGLPYPWVLASVHHRGRNITDMGFDARPRQDLEGVRVAITDVTSEVTGRVVDGSGAGVPGAVVVAVPTLPQFRTPVSRRIALTEADDTGQYGIRGLPPGEYRLTALVEFDRAALGQPAALQALADAGSPITIKEVEARQMDLRVVSMDGRTAGARR
jgi:hypothetical protein